MSEKRDIARSVASRRAEADAAVRPQWRTCFWTRPFGHVHDGSTAYDLHGVRGEYSEVCLFCGKPSHIGTNDIKRLETAARIAHLYPIARQVPKASVAS